MHQFGKCVTLQESEYLALPVRQDRSDTNTRSQLTQNVNLQSVYELL